MQDRRRDVQSRQLAVKGLLDTGAVVSFMPVSTWTDMVFDWSDLIPISKILVSVMRIADTISESGQKLSRRCLSLQSSRSSPDIKVGVARFLSTIFMK